MFACFGVPRGQAPINRPLQPAPHGRHAPRLGSPLARGPAPSWPATASPSKCPALPPQPAPPQGASSGNFVRSHCNTCRWSSLVARRMGPSFPPGARGERKQGQMGLASTSLPPAPGAWPGRDKACGGGPAGFGLGAARCAAGGLFFLFVPAGLFDEGREGGLFGQGGGHGFGLGAVL